MESLLPIFLWVVLPKQDAISGITGFPFPFGVWILKKCQLWHENHIPTCLVVPPKKQLPCMAWKSYPYLMLHH